MQDQLSRRHGISETPWSSSPDSRDSQNCTATSVELDESSRIPVEFVRAKTERWHRGSGRRRPAHETRGISDGGLRGVSKHRTSGDPLAGLRETRGISAGGARNQRFCEERVREDGPVISKCTRVARVRRRTGYLVYTQYKQARRNSRTAECSRPDIQGSCLLRH
jgi:hypothetical protein